MSEKDNERDEWAKAFESAKAYRANKPFQPREVVVVPFYKNTLEFISYTLSNKVICRDPSLPKDKRIIEIDGRDMVLAEDLKFFRRGFYQHRVPVIFPSPTNSVRKMTRDSVAALKNVRRKK